MLYDPKRWKTKTVPTLAGFIEFLGGQRKNKRYDWANCSRCAIAQYLSRLGIDYATSAIWRDLSHWEFHVVMPEPHTFGAALNRARLLERCQ